MIEKFILHGDATYNLAPFKFPWAFTMAQNSLANHWHPQEVNMSADKACYEMELSQAERYLFKYVFSSLTTSDLAIAGNLTERFYGLIKAAEIRLYLARQIAEEGLHSVSYQHIIESLGLDEGEVYGLYRNVPEIKAWFDFASDQIGREDVLMPIIFNTCLWEGVFFPTAFASIFSLQRRNLMLGTGSQIQLIFRDESMHISFGIKLLRSMFDELGSKPLQTDVHQLFADSMDRIDEWAHRCIPDVLGYSAALHKEHSRFLADRRLRALGYEPLFHGKNVLPWLDEQVSIKKERNFFEQRVTEYAASGSLSFEESGSLAEITNWK